MKRGGESAARQQLSGMTAREDAQLDEGDRGRSHCEHKRRAKRQEVERKPPPPEGTTVTVLREMVGALDA